MWYYRCMEKHKVWLIRSLELAGAILLPLIFVGCIILLISGMAYAHSTDRAIFRLEHNRYFCYTQEELLKQVDIVLHSIELPHAEDKVIMIHDLLYIHEICQNRTSK